MVQAANGVLIRVLCDGQAYKVSNTGLMLIDAYKESPSDDRKIQNVFLNAMMKYQTDNPFRRNENSNVPLLLLLNVLNKLKADKTQNGAGYPARSCRFSSAGTTQTPTRCIRRSSR